VKAGRARPWLLVAPATALLAWGGNHFTPLLLMYRQVDGYTSFEVDLFLAFYILGLVPGFLIGGPLSDQHGRRRVMVAGIAMSAVGSAVLAVGAASAYWLCAGRLVIGLSVAVAMVAGTAWIEELSQAPHDQPGKDDPGKASGARRASLALTAGFGIGAGVSGALAQWAPAPTVLPDGVQVGLLLAAAIPLRWAPETVSSTEPARSLVADLRIPREARGRFWRVVVPTAPWAFGALAIAYVVAPALVGSKVGDDRVAFATLLTVVALGTGALTQPLVGRIAEATGGRQLVLGLGLTFVGVVLCAIEASVLSPALAVVIALVMGVGYGISIVSGLLEVQRMAGPDDLAGMTGIYCCLTYVGFTLPVILASLAGVASYEALLGVVALVCLACTVAAGWNLRAAREPDPVPA
jgi:predicted MFS family arabinose efflux permease